MQRGLLDALRNMAVDDRDAGLALHLLLPQELPRLGAKEEVDVYRIVHEALANILKHAEAANAWVRLFVSEHDLCAIIEDDGVGMCVEARDEAAGFGLANMYRRADAIGGTLTVESEPGEGTTIMLELPLGGGGPPGWCERSAGGT